QPAQPAVREVHVFHPAGEADLAAQRLDALAERLDDRGQAVAPQVGAVLVEDGGLALALGEQLQDAAHLGPGAAAGELAVAERAGPALAEEGVALRVERPARVEGAHVADPVRARTAALPHQRPLPV